MLEFPKCNNNIYFVVAPNKKFCGELYRGIDGYYVYEPSISTGGYIESWFLREIADKLDILNIEWD